MHRHTLLMSLCSPALATLAGCATAPAANPGGRNAPVVVAAAGEDAGIARARADSIRLPYTAADIHFMSAMIGHHAQALHMARLAPERSATASVRTLAERILSGQEDEIRTMQTWLRDRNQPVPAAAPGSHASQENHTGHTGHDMHAAAMPGMLTGAQLRQLEAASGAAFDRLFLRYMIQHHQGAVQMVEQLFASYGAAQDETVFKFASDVNVDQRTEIARMQGMLEDLVFAGDP